MLDSSDADAIKAASEELEKSAHKLAEALYKKAEKEQTAQSAAAEPDAAPAGDGEKAEPSEADDVVDADFEEVKPS